MVFAHEIAAELPAAARRPDRRHSAAGSLQRPRLLSRGRTGGPCLYSLRLGRLLEHDPKKWIPVLGKDHARNNNLERDDDSRRNHLALVAAPHWAQARSMCPR